MSKPVPAPGCLTSRPCPAPPCPELPPGGKAAHSTRERGPGFGGRCPSTERLALRPSVPLTELSAGGEKTRGACGVSQSLRLEKAQPQSRGHDFWGDRQAAL